MIAGSGASDEAGLPGSKDAGEEGRALPLLGTSATVAVGTWSRHGVDLNTLRDSYLIIGGKIIEC